MSSKKGDEGGGEAQARHYFCVNGSYMLSTLHIYSTIGVSMPRSGGTLGLSNRSVTFPSLDSSLRSIVW